MQRTANLDFAGKSLAIAAVLVFWSSSIFASAQSGSQGQDAVYNPSNAITGSSSFIDASTFAKAGVDFCKVLNGILSGASTQYPAAGAVIDARGLPGTTPPTSMTCTTSPWGSGSNTVNVPSTILLPATGGAKPTPIMISIPWILPPNTHLIGEGDGIPSSGFTPGTTIQAATGFSGTTMIQFGPSSGFCFPDGGGHSSICVGISVENLTLDGQSQSINGITNQLAGDPSPVNHVSLYRIVGTGLLVSDNATNSGPYSNITFDAGGFSVQGTVCAQILNTGSTHGIHGLTCTTEANPLDAKAAVSLDASNNLIEDVRIMGFYDGIRIGYAGAAQSNVLVNILGDTAPPPCKPSCSTPVNVVHITSNNIVTDLSIMGAANAGGPSTTTIQDDLTSPSLSDPTVAIYALGEPAAGGYSRYTTSPNAVNWAVGASSPTDTCTRGSLYSCVNSAYPSMCNSTALWACALNIGGTLQWIGVQ